MEIDVEFIGISETQRSQGIWSQIVEAVGVFAPRFGDIRGSLSTGTQFWMLWLLHLHSIAPIEGAYFIGPKRDFGNFASCGVHQIA